MSDALGLYYAYKTIKLMSTPWDKWHAFDLGLIDADGKTLKKASTPDEKDAMGKFGILVRNLKRMLERLPFGKTRTASLAAALYLLKEDDEAVKYGVEKIAYQIMKEINEGVASADLLESCVDEDLALKGTVEIDCVLSEHACRKFHATDETFLGYIVYEGKDLLSGKTIRFLKESIKC